MTETILMKTCPLDELRLTLLEKKNLNFLNFLFTCQPFAMFEKTERLKTFFHDKINNLVCHLGIDVVFSVIEIIADSIFI